MRDPFNIKAQAGAVFDEKMRKREIGQRIMQAMSDIGITQEALAEKVELKADSLKNYTQGRAEPKDSFYQVMRDLGISPEWLRYGRGTRFEGNEAGEFLKQKHNEVLRLASENFNAIEEIMSKQASSAQPLRIEKTNIGSPISSIDAKGIIRVYMTPANAGRGFALEDMPDAQDARPLFTNNDDVIVVPVSGNSMEPVIMDGDRVYVDTSRKEPRFGEIVLCNVDGVNYVKYYIKKDDGKIYLASLNKNYPPMRINGFNNSRVYGVVVQISRTPERANMQDFVIEE